MLCKDITLFVDDFCAELHQLPVGKELFFSINDCTNKFNHISKAVIRNMNTEKQPHEHKNCTNTPFDTKLTSVCSWHTTIAPHARHCHVQITTQTSTDIGKMHSKGEPIHTEHAHGSLKTRSKEQAHACPNSSPTKANEKNSHAKP